ncbi:hypothetical protein CEUSTIGMA_g9439.t1 [Chlamydomonas eustigma]|uniref:serine--tRNA ligase n=1 Tax=Chlamydomonas eustigma TaxID=1157962 RepID=A0A250XG11_9CHLO|nr:hypothetical protein CEUSTIGMA_g9439.t1 [Chlamydomonas eustigma]|eukprot:GAX82011.1 hypothetical protein CEUSTIGMA_g9439.t1 [Chlamydomonas eustigma]
MLDINNFRPDKGGDPEVVRQSQLRRNASPDLVEQVISADRDWRKLNFQFENLSKELNLISKGIAALKKDKQSCEQDAERLTTKAKALRQEVQKARDQESQALSRRTAALLEIGNIVDADVPISNDEAHNRVLRVVGTPSAQEPWMRSHPELVKMLGIANLDAGQTVAGSRGYYLLGQGVILNQAIINYALQFLASRGFEPIHTPFFMTREVLEECAQLSQFDDELYRITESGDASTSSGNDKYLIATSEQPLCALHRQAWLEAAELPLRYAGFSTCFRREVGSHGKDTLGIFRVHQFEKVEQFCLTPPDQEASNNEMEAMIRHAEDFYQSLGIPFRVVSIVSGALNKAASKKYDLEAWFPAGQSYRELVSCSNCTDYQARRLGIRMRASSKTAPPDNAQIQKKDIKEATSPPHSPPHPHPLGSSFVHMLNSTLVASQRAICCILENHQTPQGIVIPKPLRPFMMGQDFLPFKMPDSRRGGAVLTDISRRILHK